MAVKSITITIPPRDLPAPGEVTSMTVEGYEILIENTAPPAINPADEAGANGPAVGEIVRYVPVDITAPGAQVRHAAPVRFTGTRTRVDTWTLCSATNSRRVARRLDAEPLTRVTCAQCRAQLVAEGLLS